jgi:hypothetical protein
MNQRRVGNRAETDLLAPADCLFMETAAPQGHSRQGMFVLRESWRFGSVDARRGCLVQHCSSAAAWSSWREHVAKRRKLWNTGLN